MTQEQILALLEKKFAAKRKDGKKGLNIVIEPKEGKSELRGTEKLKLHVPKNSLSN